MNKALLLLSATTFLWIACDDNLSEIGSSILPPQDKITVKTDSVEIKSDLMSTFEIEKAYISGTSLLLGNFDIANYGSLKTNFATQFYPTPKMDLGTKEELLDSMVLHMTYFKSFVGDSMAPMQATVYELNGNLKFGSFPYTNIIINNTDYNEVLGQRTFIASDHYLPDSIRNAKTYAAEITVPLKKELLTKFYKEYKTNPATFQNKKNFEKFFPGIYVKTNYGSGAVINNGSTYITFHYRTEKEVLKITDKTVNGIVVKDTVKTIEFVPNTKIYLNVTGEVSYVTQITNENPSTFTQPNPNATYLKTPIALATSIVLPTADLVKKLQESGVKRSVLNNMSFKIDMEELPKNSYEISYCPNLLLIRKSMANKFFEGNRSIDNKNSFIAQYNSKNKSYSFGNISALVTNIIKLNPDTIMGGKNDEMVVYPVSVYTDQNSAITTISHYTKPSLTKLKKGVKVYYTISEY